MYKRTLGLVLNERLPSFFLWGPRQAGKSSLLREAYPSAHFVDLLKSELHFGYLREPHRFREECLQLARPVSRIVIDEIQKVPALLDEVHWLIENKKLRFSLCGSSARKVKRGHANLLGGRALRFELYGLTCHEIGDAFDLNQYLNAGYLPSHYDSSSPRDLLRAYCSDYLKEEIAAEGLVRRVPEFSRFLEMAALSDTELVSFATFSRETGVSAPTVRSYYSILEDTLIGQFLPAYRKRPKRRTIESPKFYFFDVGVVNYLARRGEIQAGSELFGKAFENAVFHELNCYRAYIERDLDLSFWKLSSQAEVDFILGDMEVAIEAKGSNRIGSHHLKGLIELKRDFPKVKKGFVVCNEQHPRKIEDSIVLLPFKEFTDQLWSGKII